MKRCPITYETISEQENFSRQGLKLLSPQLKQLHSLNYTAYEQREEAITRVGKMSIQGIQPKLSAQLKIKEGCFKIMDQNGHYILKLQSDLFPELPENEALTMSLASTIGLEVPIHGLIYSKDNSMTYFIKRFDRTGHKGKIAVEDFSQLLGFDRNSKYNSSMEKVISVIEKYCTFPKIEYVKFFKLTLFNFLIGNEDMHLKNFSLITRKQKVTLSPAYDLLNSTIAQKGTEEEMALPLNEKKNHLRRNDLLEYLPKQRLNLNEETINEVVSEIKRVIPHWITLIKNSFLSLPMQEKYIAVIENRCQRLQLNIS